MNPVEAQVGLEDVLDAFAVESDTGSEMLARYLRDFPQFARELIDLGRELARDVYEDEASLTEREREIIDSAWRRHTDAAPQQTLKADPFATLSTAKLRETAKRLDVPRQVITAFRERRVLLETIPRQFLQRLAKAIPITVDHLIASLSAPPALALTRSYKAEGKPGASAAVSFEQILIEAGVPDERRAALLADAD